MLGGLIGPREFELYKMLDNVFDERLSRAQLAASQTLDLPGDILRIDAVAGRWQTTQQLGLLLCPGGEILLVKYIGRRDHGRNIASAGDLENRIRDISNETGTVL